MLKLKKTIYLLTEINDVFINGIFNDIGTGKYINYLGRSSKNFTKCNDFDLHRLMTVKDKVHILRRVWYKSAFVWNNIKYLHSKIF